MKTLRLLAPLFACALPALVHGAACCSGGDETPAPATATSPLPARSLFNLDAHWTTDAGGELALARLRGETLVVAMIFTHCEYACPMLVHDLRKLREQLPPASRERVRFVLVTLDPERDTPAVLKTYRDAQALDERWTLLRGGDLETKTLAMLLGVQFRREANGQFGHSNLLTVLSPDGEIIHQRNGLKTPLTAMTDAILRSTTAATP